jgi:hypothetical protein
MAKFTSVKTEEEDNWNALLLELRSNGLPKDTCKEFKIAEGSRVQTLKINGENEGPVKVETYKGILKDDSKGFDAWREIRKQVLENTEAKGKRKANDIDPEIDTSAMHDSNAGKKAKRSKTSWLVDDVVFALTVHGGLQVSAAKDIITKHHMEGVSFAKVSNETLVYFCKMSTENATEVIKYRDNFKFKATDAVANIGARLGSLAVSDAPVSSDSEDDDESDDDESDDDESDDDESDDDESDDDK